MKVLFISGAYPPLKDGIGDYTAKLIEGLRKKGFVQIEIISQKNLRRWNLFGIMSIMRRIKQDKFDIVHIQFPSSRFRRIIALAFLPLFIKIACRRTKVITTLHEFSISYPINKLRQLTLSLFSDRVIITDDGDLNQLSRGPIGAIIRDKLATIPIGSNIDVYKQDRAESDNFLKKFKLDSNTRVISFFGFVHKNKGLEALLRAMAELKNTGYSIYLILIADLKTEDIPYHKKIRDLIDSLGIKDSIYLTGYCSTTEASNYLSISEICVLPFLDGASLRRGTLMAAFSHALPVITTKSEKYVPKEFVDRSNIFLVPVNDSKALKEAIRLLGEDSALRERIGKGAKQLSEKFSWDEVASKHIKLYNNLCNLF